VVLIWYPVTNSDLLSPHSRIICQHSVFTLSPIRDLNQFLEKTLFCLIFFNVCHYYADIEATPASTISLNWVELNVKFIYIAPYNPKIRRLKGLLLEITVTFFNYAVTALLGFVRILWNGKCDDVWKVKLARKS
jgi:hypothetical protein